MKTMSNEFKLNINDFKNGLLEKSGLIPVNEINIKDLISGTFYIKAVMLKNNFEINIEIKYIKQYKCSRCLIDFEKENVIKDFAEVIKSIKKEDEGTNLIFYKDKVIDISNFVRDIIILNDDMIHLCKNDCKGLCQVCGNNLNIKKCECKESKPLNIFGKIFKNNIDLKS